MWRTNDMQGILGRSAWFIATYVALAFGTACSAADADPDAGADAATNEVPLTLAECHERDGQEMPGLDACPRGRTQIGSVDLDSGGGMCCNAVPRITSAECQEQGGERILDNGGGSTYRDGCPAGQVMIATLNEGIEGGICCK